MKDSDFARQGAIESWLEETLQKDAPHSDQVRVPPSTVGTRMPHSVRLSRIRNHNAEALHPTLKTTYSHAASHCGGKPRFFS